MAEEKKTYREKQAEKERQLDKLSTFGIARAKKDQEYEKTSPIHRAMRAIKGEKLDTDNYGTSMGKGASYVSDKTSREEWNKGKSLLDMEGKVRQAMREAASEERREAKEPRPAPKKKEEKMDAATRRAMNNMADKEKRRKMGERYDEIMPSPEPGEAVPRQKKKAGGAVMKAAKGYAKGGMAMCGASVPPAQKKK